MYVSNRTALARTAGQPDAVNVPSPTVLCADAARGGIDCDPVLPDSPVQARMDLNFCLVAAVRRVRRNRERAFRNVLRERSGRCGDQTRLSDGRWRFLSARKRASLLCRPASAVDAGH